MSRRTGTLKWVAIRADSSEIMGSGHVMRCLTLADALQRLGYEVVFFSADSLDHIKELVERRGHRQESLALVPGLPGRGPYAHSEWLVADEGADADASSLAISYKSSGLGGHPMRIIVDHYALGAPWERSLSRCAPVVAIDDLNDRPHVADALLDQTFGKSADAYRRWVSANTTLLVGARYALLRPEFAALRQQSLARRESGAPVANILVTLGGVDKDNITEQVLWALDSLPGTFTVTVVTGIANPHRRHLREVTRVHWPKVRLLEQVADMAGLMLKADLCIGAAGSTSWERCALGLPTVTLTLAANQRAIAENLAKAGAAINFGSLSPDRVTELRQCLLELTSQPQRLCRMAMSAAEVCDGHGVERVLRRIGLNVD